MSFSKHNNLEQPDQGAQSWDAIMNENLGILEAGFTIRGTAGTTVLANEVAYIDTDKKFQLAIAGAGNTLSRYVGFIVEDINFNSEGFVRHVGYQTDPNWSFVPGPVYLSDSVAGDVTQTAPSDSVLVGFAIQTNELIIKPWIDRDISIPGFSAHKNGTDQAGITNDIWTKVTFSTEVYDVDDEFASNTWTPSVGIVRMKAGVTLSILGDGNFLAMALFKNDVLFKYGSKVFNGAVGENISVGAWDDNANGSDTYDVYVMHNQGLGLTVDGNSAKTFFMGS